MSLAEDHEVLRDPETKQGPSKKRGRFWNQHPRRLPPRMDGLMNRLPPRMDRLMN
jgi:hypothetical protein